jgi:hypothetical protein
VKPLFVKSLSKFCGTAFFGNFLTARDLVARFQQQIHFALRNQRPGGVVVVLGGVGGPYPAIYQMVEDIVKAAGHRRIPGIPEVFDDSFRRAYFPRIKAFNDGIWKHLEGTADTAKFNRDGYPPYWDPAAPIVSLKAFAVRVYRKPR